MEFCTRDIVQTLIVRYFLNMTLLLTNMPKRIFLRVKHMGIYSYPLDLLSQCHAEVCRRGREVS